ncbi:MAG: class E sortase [Acidimicrobiia bacterium]|nr:class E sortase [Acidimicrobiia bacterium]
MRPKTIRAIRGTGWTFIWLGVYLLGFVAYQLWFTNLLTAREQSALAAGLDEHFAEVVVEEVEYEPVIPSGPSTTTTTVPDTGPPPPEPEPRILLQEAASEEGEAFAQIRIPAVDLDVTVVEGVRRRDLKKGPGHLPGTPLPGQPGNAVVSGHRTTYGAPFGDLGDLAIGDLIEVETALGTHVYAVREAPERCRTDDGLCVVAPTDLWVTEPREGAWLTLTTCHPRFSSRQRLIVFAELVRGPNAEVIVGA